MKKIRFCITTLFACFLLQANAQIVSVYKKGGEPVSFDLNEVDSVRFLPESIYESIDEFPYTGSYGSPNSKIWGNTGLIPVEYGQRVTYTSAGLNDYCCVFFNANKEAISFGEKAPAYNQANGKSTIISESLTAPQNTSYVCFYGTTKAAKSYVNYTFHAEIDRQSVGSNFSNTVTSFPFTGSYESPNSKIWGNTGLMPISYGYRVSYTSAGLTDYCCVFFDKNERAISFGRKAPNYSEGNGKATIISEKLDAPVNSAYVCFYGVNKIAKSYVDYTFKAQIERADKDQDNTRQTITEFPYYGSYSNPASKGWNNTGMIPIEGNTFVRYISGGLNDYLCVFFDKNKKAVYFGTRTPGLVNGEGKSTILSETLVAPENAAYVCVYGNNNTQRTYVDYHPYVCIYKDDEYASYMMDYLENLASQVKNIQGTSYDEIRMQRNKEAADLIQNYPEGTIAGNNHYVIPAAISITDDDTGDAWLNASYKKNGRNGGFYSALYPVLASLGIPATEACVGRNIGLDVEKPNLVAKAAKELAEKAGWELANHTMDHRYRYAYKIQLLSDVTSLPITPKSDEYSSNSCTYVYVESENKCYYYDLNKQWSVIPHGYEPVYLMDFEGNHIGDNPCYDNEYEIWQNQQKMEQYLNYRPVTFIQPGHRSSKKRVEYAKATHKYMLSDAGATSQNFLQIPLSMSIKRISVNVAEGSSNEVGDEYCEELKNLFSEVLENGQSGIMMLHMYTSGWSNEINSQLVSNGGTYPDSWVHPINVPESCSDWLKPAQATGLSDWSEWYPCPGTRLYQLWRFLKYAKEKGILFMTVRDNLDRMANKTEAGYYVRSKQAAFDDNDYDYFVEDCFGNITLHKK